ncbi:hypothetical protein CCH79_00016700 [Gambusia affinis]|uniref:Uncharacterized protein n=1 Tax=Gambusia affinis TaxID=33528 RepID=A0A315UT54_GAMAF|nr:hypothetical protein CCH79_00016700 [Gambusia affinis]
MSLRTHEVLSKHILPNVLKQGGQHWQQGEGGVVDDLSHSAWLLSGVGELAQLQVLLSFLQIFCHTIKVVLPMLCSYMSHWWEHGPESNPDKDDSCCTSVTSEHMNTLLGNILKIIYNNLGIDEGAWMKRLAVFSQPIISKAKAQLLQTHFLPLMDKLKKVHLFFTLLFCALVMCYKGHL